VTNRGLLSTTAGVLVFWVCVFLVFVNYQEGIQQVVRAHALTDSGWDLLVEVTGWIIFLLPCLLLAQYHDESKDYVQFIEKQLIDYERWASELKHQRKGESL
jgi:hypothetical protein